jgi:hypothetical protein
MGPVPAAAIVSLTEANIPKPQLGTQLLGLRCAAAGSAAAAAANKQLKRVVLVLDRSKYASRQARREGLRTRTRTTTKTFLGSVWETP